MADQLACINAAQIGCSDLDEPSIADQLIGGLQDIGSHLELDLRECFLDYGPCSRVTDFLLGKMAAMQGSKELIIDTLIDLGSEDSMALLLTKNSEELVGRGLGASEVREALIEYCRRHSIDFYIDVFAIDMGATEPKYRNIKRYDLSAVTSKDKK